MNLEMAIRQIRNPEPEIDLAARTIRHAIITRTVATDGGVILPLGVDTQQFEKNPIVNARHAKAETPHSPTIARCEALGASELEMVALTRFAETQLGEEYAHLYGINPSRTVYMRAWSVTAPLYDVSTMSFEQVRRLLDPGFDPEMLPAELRKAGRVWVARRSILQEYSAVHLGADKGALSRAMDDGVRLAGEILSDLDLAEAQRDLTVLRERQSEHGKRLDRIEKEIQALRRDGADAARRGDSSAILREIKSIRAGMKP